MADGQNFQKHKLVEKTGRVRQRCGSKEILKLFHGGKKLLADSPTRSSFMCIGEAAVPICMGRDGRENCCPNITMTRKKRSQVRNELVMSGWHRGKPFQAQ